MMKELIVPTFLRTLSFADFRWNELVSTTNKFHTVDMSDKNIDNFGRCCLLISNPVIIAKHFQYRVELFFK